MKTKDIWYFQAFNIVDSILLCQESSYLLFSVKEMDDFLAFDMWASLQTDCTVSCYFCWLLSYHALPPPPVKPSAFVGLFYRERSRKDLIWLPVFGSWEGEWCCRSLQSVLYFPLTFLFSMWPLPNHPPSVLCCALSRDRRLSGWVSPETEHLSPAR